MLMLHVARWWVAQVPTYSTFFTQTPATALRKFTRCDATSLSSWQAPIYSEWGVDFSNLYNDVNNGHGETVVKLRPWFNYIYTVVTYQGIVFFSGFRDWGNRQFTTLLQDSYTHCVCTHTHAESRSKSEKITTSFLTFVIPLCYIFKRNVFTVRTCFDVKGVVFKSVV